MTAKTAALLRTLPAVDRLLADERVRSWQTQHPRPLIVAALQAALEEVRAEILAGSAAVIDLAALLARAEQRLTAQATPSLRRVINATGVVLHTGLGRAPLSAAAIEALTTCAAGYCNLELDLATGARGKRSAHVAGLLCELTGAEAATVVNNNAAATLMILNTLARGAEVIVSRGQLVEIGGEYRLPEMMSASGAILREVGTTNRTRLSDYERAIGDRTAALLRVHTSNYRIVGFTQDVELAELVALGRRAQVPVVDDIGSGLLQSRERERPGKSDGLEHTETRCGSVEAHEPLIRASIAAGADVVCFSGDKLLGGPQAGIILGRTDLIHRIEANPLMRTYRVDKLVLAALEATLRAYHDPQMATSSIPALALLTTPLEVLDRRAHELADRLREQLPNARFEVITDHSVAGGGALPACELETRCVSWHPDRQPIDDSLACLRMHTPAVVARAKEGRILFDVRTVLAQDFADLVVAIASTAATVFRT